MSETATMTLTEFLLARYAELDPDDVHDRGCDVNSYVSFPCNCGVPERMRADLEAKRRIVQQCAERVNGRIWGTPSTALAYGRVHDAASVLQALALPHADHPDCRPEWGP